MNGYPLPNADFIHAIRLQVPINTVAPVQFPELEIPDDFLLNVKADPANPAASLVYIASAPGASINPDQSWPLAVNENSTWRIKNANVLFASASALACWVVISVELRRGAI